MGAESLKWFFRGRIKAFLQNSHFGTCPQFALKKKTTLSALILVLTKGFCAGDGIHTIHKNGKENNYFKKITGFTYLATVGVVILSNQL